MTKNAAYYEAERKIKEAHRAGETSLQLNHLRGSDNELLDEIPNSIGQLIQLRSLTLAENQLTFLPACIGSLVNLEKLWFGGNQVKEIPNTFIKLTNLRDLAIGGNGMECIPEFVGELRNLEILWIGWVVGNSPFTFLPEFIKNLHNLKAIYAGKCRFEELPEWVGSLSKIQSLSFPDNRLTKLPYSILKLNSLKDLDIQRNPINPELAAAYEQGLDAVKAYLRAKSQSQTTLNEAKLILIGEGEVGKSCLLNALRGDEWEEGKPTTHGIEIKPVAVTDPDEGTEITLNGWDFGGQRVYRPTHQLFFSAPAVCLVVWKPREGPQQGFVKEWIKLVKHREPDAKILVVATHGGPNARQPDIDRQEIWDLFGKDTVVDFFFVQSKPDENGERHGIAELRDKIAEVAAGLPEMGRTFPKHWQDARVTLRSLLSRGLLLSQLDSIVTDVDEAKKRLQKLGENRLCLESAMSELSDLFIDENRARAELNKARIAYLPLDRVYDICKEHKVEKEDAQLLLRISKRVGDLIHYEHDPLLKDIVILKPDWLATAISFVLDDENTRKQGSGLVDFQRLQLLWNNCDKDAEDRYPAELHPIFLKLMQRFDLCYQVKESGKGAIEQTNLIAQLVPDVRPDISSVWPTLVAKGDEQQTQICRIVDTSKNETAAAEGLFYQLIVRLHKYSLGKDDYKNSIHWQRGLILEDSYGSRAFPEHFANDIRITVRSPYPQQFLGSLTHEIKYLVESFWEGLRCEVTVPCLVPNKDGSSCSGLFEVEKLLENKRRGRPEQPCPVCNEWQNIKELLYNAPASRPNPLDIMLIRFDEVMDKLSENHISTMARFDNADRDLKLVLSQVEDGYRSLMQVLVDEAKEGPRLFSFEPADPGFFDRPNWVSQKFKLTLWCEHSRLPLCEIADEQGECDEVAGVYELKLPREWLTKSAPFLKVLNSTLSLVLPVAASATKLALDETAYKGIEDQLKLGQKSINSLLKGADKSGAWLGESDGLDIEQGQGIRAQGAVLRQLQVWLKEKDISYGGMVRVQNKRQEFLWVHPRFEGEY